MNAFARAFLWSAMYSCLIGALVIEVHHYFFAMRVHRGVAVDPARNAECDNDDDQSKSDKREQVQIQHGHLL